MIHQLKNYSKNPVKNTQSNGLCRRDHRLFSMQVFLNGIFQLTYFSKEIILRIAGASDIT